MKNLPSEKEIRERYHITQRENFAVEQQSEIPDPTEALRQQVKMNKKGFWDGFEVWTKTTILGGVILAVIFVGGFINGLEMIYKYGNIIYSNKDQIVSYTAHFASYTKDRAIGFLVDTNSPPTEEDKKYQEWAIFPTGSSLIPVSGDWRPS